MVVDMGYFIDVMKVLSHRQLNRIMIRQVTNLYHVDDKGQLMAGEIMIALWQIIESQRTLAYCYIY